MILSIIMKPFIKLLYCDTEIFVSGYVSLYPDDVQGRNAEDLDDEQLHEAFENWKSKTYALSLPLRVVALQGSLPPAWIKVCDQLSGCTVALMASCSKENVVFFLLSVGL